MHVCRLHVHNPSQYCCNAIAHKGVIIKTNGIILKVWGIGTKICSFLIKDILEIVTLRSPIKVSKQGRTLVNLWVKFRLIESFPCQAKLKIV